MTTYVRDKWKWRFDQFGLAAAMGCIAIVFLVIAMSAWMTDDSRARIFMLIAVSMSLLSVVVGYVASTRFPSPSAIEIDQREIRLFYGPKKILAIPRYDFRGFRRQFKDAGVEVAFVRNGREVTQSLGVGYVSPEGVQLRQAKKLCVFLNEAFKLEDEEASIYHYGKAF